MQAQGISRQDRDMRGYITFVKAASIIGIYFYHFFDYYKLGGVPGLFQEGILKVVFSDIQGTADFIWRLSQLCFAFGNKGVQLFVLTSGFGLYLSYLDNRTSWTTFYKKRALRIMPLYWLVLLLSFVFVFKKASIETLVCHLFLVQTYTEDYLSFGALWFIGYIFQLYLMFPVLVGIFRNRYAKWALFASSFFMMPLALQAMRQLGFEPVGVFPTKHLSVFLLGMILAESYHSGKSLHRNLVNPFSAAVSLLLLALLTYLISYHIVHSYLTAIFSSIFIFFGLYGVYSITSCSRTVRRATDVIAYSSYSFYLTHLSLILIFAQMLSMSLNKGGIIREVTIFVIGGYIPGGKWTFVFPALEFLFIILLVSYMIQRTYNHLVMHRLERAIYR